MDVCAVLLVANIMRCVFWLGEFRYHGEGGGSGSGEMEHDSSGEGDAALTEARASSFAQGTD